jgi:hypothetical protein
MTDTPAADSTPAEIPPADKTAAEATATPAAPVEAGPVENRRTDARSRNNRRGPAQRQQQAQRPAQPPRTVNPVLEQLFGLYPRLFGAQFLPLKLGVFHELMARHPDVFKKDELKLAMGQHARSTRYLDAVAAGHMRHDLDANPVEPVAAEHVHHAILELFRRRQARAREDLRPHLIQRLMEAVEASGLPREDYAILVRVQDEATNAVLDEALAALGMLAAKREALGRAFAASGKTIAEFADMYGMDPAEVSATLERVSRNRDAEAARAAAPASSPGPGPGTEPEALTDNGDQVGQGGQGA